MRDKIYAALLTKFPTLSKHFLGLIATQIAKKVTAEDGIDQGIQDFEALASIPELATDFQKENDRQLTVAEKKWKKENPQKAEETADDETVKKPKAEDEPPAWAKTILQEVQTLKAEKLQSSIAEKLKGNEKLKDIPASYYGKRRQPEKEEDIEAFADEVATDYAAFTQELADKGLSTTVKPVIITPTGGEKITPMMKEYLSRNKPEEQKN